MEETTENDSAHGLKATLIGFIFAVLVIGGFAAATAAASDSHDNGTEIEESHTIDEGDGHEEGSESS